MGLPHVHSWYNTYIIYLFVGLVRSWHFLQLYTAALWPSVGTTVVLPVNMAVIFCTRLSSDKVGAFES